MATLAETLRQAGYVTPQGVTGPNAPLAKQLKNYVTNVIPTATQNISQQRADIDAGLIMGDQGIQVGDREAFERQMAQVPNLGGVMKVSGALRTAQKNAALPVEEGGLGLPANNTAAQRAEAMGYNIPVYHGTNADINAFDVTGKGKTAGAGAFLTSNPITAETYVSASGGGNILPLLLKKDDFLTANARGRNWADIWTDQLNAKSAKQKYSLDDLGLDKYSSTTTDELGMIANELSKKGVEIKNVKDLGPNSHVMRVKEYLNDKYGITPDVTFSNVTGKQFYEAQKAMKKLYESQKSDIYAVQDPSLIRSKFAAFDPKKISSPNILAGGLAIPIVDEDNRKAMLEKLFNSQ